MSQRLFLLTIAIALLLGACARNTGAPEALTSNDLIGQPVETQDGELVGSVRGLLLTPEEGRIEYAIVQLAPGSLEFGKMPMHDAPGRVLVPWRLLTIAPSGDHLVADFSLERVRNAPPAPDRLQTSQPGWEEPYSTYWCEGEACAGATATHQQPALNRR